MICIKATHRVLGRLPYFFFLILLYMLVASAVLYPFLRKWTNIVTDPTKRAYSFQQIMEFSSHRPYVYRVLMPCLVNRTYALIPKHIREGNPAFLQLGAEHFLPASEISTWSSELKIKYFIACYWMFLFLFASLLALRGLTLVFFRGKRLLADVGPMAFGLLLPLSFRGGGGFIYDFPEMFFLFACLALIASGRYTWFYVLYPLALLNKESFALCIVFYAILLLIQARYGNMVVHLVTQTVIAVVIIVFVKWMFSEHPGGTVEFHFANNIRYWSIPKSWVSFMTAYTPFIPFPTPLNILVLPFFGWMLFSGWREKPRILKILFLTSGLISIPLFLLFCWNNELRNLSLMFPFAYLLSCHTILGLYEETESTFHPEC
jgi:hypothetical protein